MRNCVKLSCMTDIIQLEQQANGVVIITFNRPEAMNALNLEAMATFKQTIMGLVRNDHMRVLVLTGAGDRAFCSGGDLVELSQYPKESDAQRMIATMGDALIVMERLLVPVIGAINGYALGGGSEIALACDMRFADENVKMGMVQINMGLIPGWGAGQRLIQTVGYAQAIELLLRGDVLQAEQLRALGLVNHITPAGAALDHALTFANQIAERPRKVVRAIKTIMQAGRVNEYESALRLERELFPSLWADRAHLDAVDAFLQRQANKRKQTPDEQDTGSP